MAYTPTVLLDGLVSVAEVNGLKFQENETRRSKYGALEAYRAGTSLLIPTTRLEALKTSTERVTSIDTFVKEANGTGTARKCAGTGGGSTARTALTYATFVEEFSVSDLEHSNNLTSKQEAFNHLFNERIKSLHNRIDAAAVTHLEANKSTVNAGTIYGASAVDIVAKGVPQLTKNEFYNNLSVEMQQNDYDAPYYNIASTSQKALMRFDLNQGAGNSVNLQFPMPDYQHYFTNRIAEVGVESSSYVVSPGTVGLVTWINQLSRMGQDIGTDRWSSFEDPFGLLGSIELKIKEGCFDNSGSFAGAEADLVTSYVMAVEVAFVKAYSSTADTGIYKYQVEL